MNLWKKSKSSIPNSNFFRQNQLQRSCHVYSLALPKQQLRALSPNILPRWTRRVYGHINHGRSYKQVQCRQPRWLEPIEITIRGFSTWRTILIWKWKVSWVTQKTLKIYRRSARHTRRQRLSSIPNIYKILRSRCSITTLKAALTSKARSWDQLSRHLESLPVFTTSVTIPNSSRWSCWRCKRARRRCAKNLFKIFLMIRLTLGSIVMSPTESSITTTWH